VSAISRTQAWCKLAVLIAEGLPAPVAIRFQGGESGGTPILSIQLESAEAFAKWCEALDTDSYVPRVHEDRWIYTSKSATWNGWSLSMAAYPPAEREPEPVTEDLRWVRHIAAHGEAEQPNQCTGCGKTGRISAHRPGCTVAAAFDAQLDRAVSE
jgi:hypothetical protein